MKKKLNSSVCKQDKREIENLLRYKENYLSCQEKLKGLSYEERIKKHIKWLKG